MSDPFSANAPAASTAPASDDPFDNATTDFIGPEDLDGRFVLFIPMEKGQAKGAQGPYDYIVGDMLVLDGGASEKIPGPFPHEVKGQRISATMMVTQLAKNVASQRMMAGRVNSRPGQFNRPAYSLGTPTPDEQARAKPIALDWLRRRTAAADPFATAG